MPSSDHRAQLEALYEMSCADDAVVLLWAMRVCDAYQPWQWADAILERGGPPRSKVVPTLRRLGVEGV